MTSQINRVQQKMDEMKSLVNKSESLTDEYITHGESEYTLENDTFNIMMLSEPYCMIWFFSVCVFFFQITLVVFILYRQLDGTIAIPFSTAVVMWNQDKEDWMKVFKVPAGTTLRKRRIFRVLFPDLFKFGGAILVLLTSFIIIIDSEDIIDLFTNFAAMQIIFLIDNTFVVLAEQGYFGKSICKGAKMAKNVRVKDIFPLVCRSILPLQVVLTITLLLCMVVGWVYIAIGQDNGRFFTTDYPNYRIENNQIAQIGDGRCDGGVLNTVQCNFDGGDCVILNLAFPKCKVDKPFLIGDGTCHEKLNIEDCGFDGGDCCPYDDSDPLLGDGQCHGLWYNTKSCNYDRGDCSGFNKKHTECFIDLLGISKRNIPVVLGDGVCNGNMYNSKVCGYENGDCTGMIGSAFPSTSSLREPSSVSSASPSSSPTEPAYIWPQDTATKCPDDTESLKTDVRASCGLQQAPSMVMSGFQIQ